MVKWIMEIVARELSILLAMRLDYSPSEDTFELVVMAWYEAFKDDLGLAVRDIDTPRMLSAFRKARGTFRSWPSPIAVIELMPPRPEKKKINYDPPADPEKSQKAFAICQDLVAGRITKEEADRLVNELSTERER